MRRLFILVVLGVLLAGGGGAPAALTTASASTCAIPASLLDKDVTVIPTSQKVVALTFDAGANGDGVQSILRTLDRRNGRGTFFLTGAFVDMFPGKSRAMAAYPVGNHTYSHPDLTTLSNAAIVAEIRAAHIKIKTVTGQDPHPYFRFPFGAANARTIDVVNGRCYVPVRWTVDTLGWKGTSGGMTRAKVVQRVVDGLRPGAIILMHVGSNPSDGTMLDAAALSQIITEVRARGYSLVTLNRLLPMGD